MRIGLAGDTMLGRNVAERLSLAGPGSLFDPALVAITNEADLLITNLECCISTHGRPWPDARKTFFFRAPTRAIDVLGMLGVSCVTLANNHAMDFGGEALLETMELLHAAGIAHAGAGSNLAEARRAAHLASHGTTVSVIGLSDHPHQWAATESSAGIAYANLQQRDTAWVDAALSSSTSDINIVSPHWGPNLVQRPSPYIRDCALRFRASGATLVAGHSAHVFHGAGDGVLYDLGDFIDDYATDPMLRNDLGLFFVVEFDGPVPVMLEAIPIALDPARTRLARPTEFRWIARRFRKACATEGTTVVQHDGRLLIDLRSRESVASTRNQRTASSV